jgi:hypothetical protein
MNNGVKKRERDVDDSEEKTIPEKSHRTTG